MRCSTSWARAASGAPCLKTCPRAAPCMTTLCAGSVTARWGVCTMLFMSKPVSWPARRPALYEQARELAGKEASPTTAIVDSQSVKGAERGARPIDPVGYDAAKKVKGRKRHAVVDTLGLMLGCAILPGNVQDRDGCLGVLKEVRRLFPFLERVIADGAYQGKETAR